MTERPGTLPPLAPSPDVARTVARTTAFGIASLAAIAVTLVLVTLIDYRFTRWVGESREMTRLSRIALTQALDRETGVRGFLLTGDSAALAPELAGRRRLPALLDSLQALTAGNAAQHARVLVAERAMQRWDREFARPALSGGTREAGRWLSTTAGKTLFDPLRYSLRELAAMEDAEYNHRAAENILVTDRLIPLLVLLEAAFALFTVVRLGRRGRTQTEEIVAHRERLVRQAAELEVASHEMEQARDRARREADEKEEALATLNAALAGSPVGVGFFGPDLRYARANPALLALIGRPEDEILGRTLAQVTPAHAEAQAMLERVRDEGRTFVDVAFRQGVGGGGRSADDRFGRASFYPISAGRRFLGVGMMVLETTEHQRLHDQLVQAQKMEAVGQLAGGIAHDFNNLLTAIVGYADMTVLALPEGDPVREDVQEIAGAGRRAAALTRQLLTFSRRQVASPEVLSLNALLADFGRMLRRVIGERVRVEERLDPSLWAVRADRGQMEQVVMNLAVNARDAMPEGGRLRVETSNVELDEAGAARHLKLRPGPHVLLSVGDEGTGIEPAALERIFEPFFTTKARGHGTGLGLSTVYAIVDQAGGAIDVQSEVGRGTTFRIWLPRAAEPAAAAPAGSALPSPAGRGTVLLVEDDDAVRQSVARMTASLGFEVLAAGSEDEALAACRAAPRVDLILSDVVMPSTTGPELAAKLLGTRPAARVLLMTGYAEEGLLAGGGLPTGMACLAKPFTLDELGAAIRRALGAPGGPA